MSLLAGRRILVTRRLEQGGTLLERLRELGAEVSEVPSIEIVPAADTGPLDRALSTLELYQWLVFTSANAVHAVRTRMDALGLAPASLGARIHVASVGAATTHALRSHYPAAVVAAEPEEDFRAEGLLAALESHPVAGLRMLLPVSERARDTLATALRARGAVVDVVTAYRTLPPASLREQLGEGRDFDLVCFASPSAVENFVAALGVSKARGLKAAAIGPVTEATARGLGLDVAVVANPSTADGMVDAIVRHFSA